MRKQPKLQPVTDTVTIGEVPAPNAPNTRTLYPTQEPKTGTLSVDPRLEYVAGGQWLWGNFGRPLSFAIDDVADAWGDDIYGRMLLDPQVFSCLQTIALGVLSQGIHLSPAVDDKSPDYQTAMEISDFCKRNLSNISFLQTMHQMMDCLVLGNRVAEIVWHSPPNGPDAGRVCLKALKVKARRSTAFVVDAYMNVIGLLGMIPGMGFTLLPAGVITDPKTVPNLLPLEKFFVLTHSPKDDDPRGTSLGRQAFSAWNDKQQAMARYIRYIAILGGGVLVGNTAEGAQAEQSVDSKGNPVVDSNGNPVIVTPEAAMLGSIVTLQDGSAAVFPFGAQLKALEVKGEGETFIKARATYNDEISLAITGQTLATNEARHQSRAASQTHQDVLSLRIQFGRTMVEDAVRGQLLKRLVEYNYGEQFTHLVPTFTLCDTEQQDFAVNATAIAEMARAGYLSPTQYQDIDSFVGLPVRPDDWQQIDAANAPVQPPAVGPDGQPLPPEQQPAAMAAFNMAGRVIREDVRQRWALRKRDSP